MELERGHSEIPPTEPRVDQQAVQVVAPQSCVLESEVNSFDGETDVAMVKDLALSGDTEPGDGDTTFDCHPSGTRATWGWLEGDQVLEEEKSGENRGAG